MSLFLIRAVFVLALIHYHKSCNALDTKLTSEPVNNLKLRIDSRFKESKEFPDSFETSFDAMGIKFDNIQFAKLSEKSIDDQLFKMTRGRLVQVHLNQTCQYYNQVNGLGFATLIRSNSSFKMIGTFYPLNDPNIEFSLVPFDLAGHSRRRRDLRGKLKLGFESVVSEYSLFRSSAFDAGSLLDVFDFLAPEYTKKRKSEIEENDTKATTAGMVTVNKPIELYVELLMVADHSVFEDHKRFLESNDDELIFANIKSYFAHIVGAVNQRYVNSFASDPDLRIRVGLKNVIILTSQYETGWSDPEVVGDPKNPTHLGKPVIIARDALKEFARFINTRKFPFTFDHAVGLVNKDLWRSDSHPDEEEQNSDVLNERSRLVGFAYVGKICTKKKYSIVEETGSFSNIRTIAHELAHNLGANHDGVHYKTFACPASDGYIMSASSNSTRSQNNLLRFSNCTISQIKSKLLRDNFERASSSAKCLRNVPSAARTNLDDRDHKIEKFPGKFWSLDEQCKMIHGSSYSFCMNKFNRVCSVLYCKRRNETSCIGSRRGAADGSICDLATGKICLRRKCEEKSLISDRDT